MERRERNRERRENESDEMEISFINEGESP